MTEAQKKKLRKPKPEKMGNGNPNWKGDDVGYGALHVWVHRNFGKPKECEKCGANKIPFGLKRYFDWALKGKVYTRLRKDWFVLCRPCHKMFDNNRRGYKVVRISPTAETRKKISESLKKKS